MKTKAFLLGAALTGLDLFCGSQARAQFNYTAGDVVVYRVGDGSAALTNAGTAVFLDEYNPVTGALDGSYNLTTAAGLVASGTATSEGLLTLSGNGQYLLATGYNTAVGTASVAGTASATVPREVATVSSVGAVVPTNINNYSANNIRSAASQDGVSIYTSGANTGILNVTSGSTGAGNTGTVISSTVTSTRNLSVVGGNLYVSLSSGTTYRVAQVGTGLPTTGGQTLTATLPAASINSPYQFAGAMLAATTVDTFYVADNGANALEKFSLVGGSFTLTGTAALTGISGLAVRAVAGGELIVATTSTGIFTLTDASGAGGTLTAAFGAALVTAGTNEVFRGDAFAPTFTVVPEPSTAALLLSAGLAAGVAVRRRARKLAA